jgi:hypothetical protein
MKPELSSGVNRTVAENEDVTKARKPRKSDPYDGERHSRPSLRPERASLKTRKH